MDVEALRLKARKTVGDDLELLADGVEMIESLVQPEVAQIVGANLIAEEAGELFILLPVSAEDVMAMLDLLDDGGELAAQSFVQPGARRSR